MQASVMEQTQPMFTARRMDKGRVTLREVENFLKKFPRERLSTRYKDLYQDLVAERSKLEILVKKKEHLAGAQRLLSEPDPFVAVRLNAASDEVEKAKDRIFEMMKGMRRLQEAMQLCA